MIPCISPLYGVSFPAGAHRVQPCIYEPEHVSGRLTEEDYTEAMRFFYLDLEDQDPFHGEPVLGIQEQAFSVEVHMSAFDMVARELPELVQAADLKSGSV